MRIGPRRHQADRIIRIIVRGLSRIRSTTRGYNQSGGITATSRRTTTSFESSSFSSSEFFLMISRTTFFKNWETACEPSPLLLPSRRELPPILFQLTRNCLHCNQTRERALLFFLLSGTIAVQGLVQVVRATGP